jgi:putative hydroxymethylpyrimidine transport system substrate-binding protein
MFRKGSSRLLVVLAFALCVLAAPAHAADKLTVLLDWFVNPDHAPLVVAKEGGFFDRAGLDVELVAPSDPSAPPRLVAAGKADIAVTYQPDLMLNVQEGLMLSRIGTLVETPLNCLIVLDSGPIKTLADLKGRKIGYSVASLQSAYINEYLKSAGLTEKDVTLVNVNFNLVTALMAGQVDAVIDGYRNVELIQLNLEGHPARAFYPEENGVPIYDELIYVTRNDLRDDPRMGKFVHAVELATVWLTNHPDEALALFLKAHKDLGDDLNKKMFAQTIARFAKRPAALDRGRYQRFAEFLKEKGIIDTVPDVDAYAVEPR